MNSDKLASSGLEKCELADYNTETHRGPTWWVGLLIPTFLFFTGCGEPPKTPQHAVEADNTVDDVENAVDDIQTGEEFDPTAKPTDETPENEQDTSEDEAGEPKDSPAEGDDSPAEEEDATTGPALQPAE